MFSSFLRRRREARERHILALLLKNGEMSGSDIWQSFQNFSVGSLYTHLARMERNGRIASRWGIATVEHGWRRPRLYRLANDA